MITAYSQHTTAYCWPYELNAFFASTSELVTSAAAKPVEALLKLIDAFPEDSDTSFQLRPITCLEV